LGNAVEVNRTDDVRRHDWFQKAAAGQRCAHRPLQLEHGRTGVADADLLPGDLIIARVPKQERAEGALAEQEEPHQDSQLVVAGCRVVTQ
jgi:hypothetical protein